jgi:hypothetical protein
MKIAWLINGHSGSGGGRIIIKIGNELIKRGHDLTFYAQDGGGIEFMSSAKTKPLSEAEGDISICSDMGRGHRVFEKFRDMKASVKIWYCILFTSEFDPMLNMSEIIKIASTNWIYRSFLGSQATNPLLMIGPMDNDEFYHVDDTLRSRVVLIYAKKASWVGAQVAELLCERDRSIIIGTMGYDSLGDSIKALWEKGKAPRVNFSLCSHRTDLINYVYAIGSVYAEVCGASSWGFNYMLGEAMRCRCPVVSTDWEGFDHLVINNETALTVPCNGAPENLDGSLWMVRPKPIAVVEKVEEMLGDKELGDRLTENAFELVTKYSIPKWVDSFEKVIS